jgi:hypothetical protein
MIEVLEESKRGVIVVEEVRQGFGDVGLLGEV